MRKQTTGMFQKPLWIVRADQVKRLIKLRKDIEAGQGALTAQQAALLADVCDALGLERSETFHVLGPIAAAWISGPVPYGVEQ